MVPTEGGIRVRDAVEAFLRYTDKPMVASSDSVILGLAQACKDRLIGIGRGTSPEKLQTRRCGEDVALDRGEEGVWIIPPFVEPAPEPATGGGTAQSGGGAAAQTVSATTAGQASTSGATATVTTDGKPRETATAIAITGNVPLESWT